MRTVVVAGVLALALGGCVTGSLVSTQGGCSTKFAGYLAMWDCIRADVAADRAGLMNNSMGVRYMATGDALAERVRAQQISDADAKVALSQELARGDAEFEARKAAVMGVNCTSNRIGQTVLTNCY